MVLTTAYTIGIPGLVGLGSSMCYTIVARSKLECWGGLIGKQRTLASVISTVTCFYLSTEVAFLFSFYLWTVPHANERTKPREFHLYRRQRHKLLLRILKRIERTCHRTGEPFVDAFELFVRKWFTFPPHDEMQLGYERGIINGPDCSKSEGGDVLCGPPVSSVKKEEVRDLIAWAFFSKHATELEVWERFETEEMFTILREEYSIDFKPGRRPGVNAKKVSLDDLQPLPRPLTVYLAVASVEVMGRLILSYFGFVRYHTKTGLSYWYRPYLSGENNGPKNDCERSPLLFFHGIAPGGLAFYLPMILRGLCKGGKSDRPVFLFENRPVSCMMCLRPLDETETLEGVLEAIDTHVGPDFGVTLCGHSFGSCPMTWMLHGAPDRIKGFVLLDPVTILLSDPDVMCNFLYRKRTDALRSIHNAAIYLGASTELGTEHYLRRHFFWYRSELWLEDVPDWIQVRVFLSGKDAILDAHKVHREIDIRQEELRSNGLNPTNFQVTLWPEARHGFCLGNAHAWNQIFEAIQGIDTPKQ